MEEIKLIADTMNIRIDSWISEKLPEHSRTYIKKLIDNEAVFVNGKTVKSNYKLKINDEVTIIVPDPVKLDVEAEKIDMDIVYEDKDILVINKQKGMVVHPAVGNYSGTLVNGLMDYCGDELSDINGVIRPGIVHRIDKDTSGLLVVAKNNIAHEKLTDMLKAHDIKRVYYAVVDGVIREESGKIDAPIGRHNVNRKKMAVNTRNGRRAVTYFKVMERFKDATLVEVRLETGRTHQIRVHMSYIGFPIMGDEVYGRRNKRINTDGQVLHAKILEFVHPVSGENMRFEVDLPDYFKEVLELCCK